MSSSSHRHFETSDHSAAYALYRSSPPRSLVEKVAANVRSGSRALAVDVGKEISHKDKLNLPIFTWVTFGFVLGCGTGQSTFVLDEYFDHVLGVDVSESQIEEARDRILNFA